MAAVAGLVAAAVAIPLDGRSVLWSRSSRPVLGPLPDRLLHPVLPARTRLLAADGSVVAQFYRQDRVSVPLQAVAPVARQAAVAAEDVRYYDHGGIDLIGIVRAGITDLFGGGQRQGGSSITQQYVRQVLALTAPTPAERAQASSASLNRKVREAGYAISLEARFSKDQILEGYLNTVYFGSGAYGIEAAAERYFGTSAGRLTLPQAALLAGLIRDPSGLDPIAHPDAASARRDQVLSAMADAHFINGAEASAALAAPLGLQPATATDGCIGSAAPFFCAWAYRSLLEMPSLGATTADRREAILTGGLTVGTTLDPRVQGAAQAAVDGGVAPGGPVAAAVDVVEPGSGNVRAMAVDRQYGPGPNRTMVNLATGGTTGFPAGSTFKVFTLAAALEQGLPLDLTIPAPPIYTASGFTNCATGAPFQPYVAHNAEAAEGGTFSLMQATWESVNTYYLQLEQRTGICRPAQIAESLGVRRVDGGPLQRVPSFTLGTNEVSPLAMSAAFAAVDAHGLYCPPVGIAALHDRLGAPLTVSPHPCQQALPPPVADTITDVLRQNVDGPDPLRSAAPASIGRPAAGKTGTTEDYSAAWFCGYTPQLGGCVWTGDPTGGFAHPLINVTISGRTYDRAFGGTVSAPIWATTMSTALAGVPPLPLP